MASVRRGGRTRYRLALLVLTALTLLTLDFRGVGPLQSAQHGARDALDPVRRGLATVFRPVTNQPGSETAVELINGSAKSIRILNKRNGAVYQVVINTLNEDNSQISNEYIRLDKDGKITGVTHVTYIKRKK